MSKDTSDSSIWRFFDLRLLAEETCLKTPRWRTPLSLNFKGIKPTWAAGNGVVSYLLEYDFQVTDSSVPEKVVLTSKLKFLLVFEAAYTVTQEQTNGFLPTVLRLAHDRLREFLHGRTMIMGLPPLVIDVYRPSTMAEPQGERPKQPVSS